MLEPARATMACPQRPRRSLLRVALGLLLACGVLVPGVASAGISLVRMQGVIGSAPGSVGRITLVVGKKSIPFSVLSAQRISGPPAMAPEILSWLGPGPPPVRIEGRKGTTGKLVAAPTGAHVTIVGNLNPAAPLLTLMEVVVEKSARAK